jgi:hypothetical protein
VLEITSRGELQAWLEDKPADWAQVIAARAALRLLPHRLWGRNLVLALALPWFRCTFISWAARNYPTYDMIAAGRVAVSSAIGTAKHIDNSLAVAITAVRVAIAGDVTRAVEVARLATNTTEGKGDWGDITLDCDWLDDDPDPSSASRRLIRKMLWPIGRPLSVVDGWNDVVGQLLKLDPTYQVWIDWYERRIRGEDAAFHIPGDTDRKADKAILARLADATDEDFWGKGATFVNTTLQNWIKEAEIALLFAPEESAELPAQNLDAIVWESDDEGRIGVDASSGVDQLSTSGEARDRHAEAQAEAAAARALCENSNAALEIKELLDRYVAALGESIETSRPGLFVQRGERLRQKLASRLADGEASVFGPLPDQVRDALLGWQSAHNAFVGLDSALAKRDSALFGPDAKRTLVGPDDIRAIAASAQQADILQPGSRETLNEAADIAPSPPDPEDRRSRWSSETAKNFGRQTIGHVWGLIKAGSVLVGGAYALGHWVLVNAVWFRMAFAGDAATLSALETVLNWLSNFPLA